MTDYEFVGGSEQYFSNESQRTAWETQREHREIVTKILCKSAMSGARSLSIFGAGPCRDIELNVLSDIFEHITLVDCDSETLLAGSQSQCISPKANVKLLGDVDLFGASELLRLYQQSNDESLIARILEKVGLYQPDQLTASDCVASTCMLSQLLSEASEAIPVSHNRFVDVLKAIRLQHIQIMFSLLNPGGHGILVTDVVSSESLPDLETTTNLKKTLRNAIANQNFLHGLNPPLIAKVFQDEGFAGKITSVKVSDPWLWKLPKRVYACFAIVFTKAADV